MMLIPTFGMNFSQNRLFLPSLASHLLTPKKSMNETEIYVFQTLFIYFTSFISASRKVATSPKTPYLFFLR